MGVRRSKTADRLSIRPPGVPAPIDARKSCLDGNAAVRVEFSRRNARFGGQRTLLATELPALQGNIGSKKLNYWGLVDRIAAS